MNKAQQAELAERLQRLPKQNPAAYVRRVLALAAAGYGYVWLGLGPALTAGHALLPLGRVVVGPVLGLALVILQALWVRVPRPGGIRVKRTDAPALFKLVDQVTSALGLIPFHYVFLTEQLNAGVLQRPLLGPFGVYRNYLLLGLPLLQALTPEEFHAILSPELGHLSRQHGVFGTWIYRIRVTWLRIAHGLERSRSFVVFGWFIGWWTPRFVAYSFVMAREHEYEADRFACTMAGAPALALALVRLEVLGRLLEEQCWPAIIRMAEAAPEPPLGLLTTLGQLLATGPSLTDARRWVRSALTKVADVEDTHPSLAERLAGIGAPPLDLEDLLLAAPARNAAQELFDEQLSAMDSSLDADWRRRLKALWNQIHARRNRLRERVMVLDRDLLDRPLTSGQAWERAELKTELDGVDAALQDLRAVLTIDPDHAGANFELGRALLRRDDPVGVDLLERAMAREPARRGGAGALLVDYFRRHGDAVKTAQYRRHTWEYGDVAELARRERLSVANRDTLLPPALAPERMAHIRSQVERFAEVVEAYVVRKEVRQLPDSPLYVLGVKLWRPWYKYHSVKWVHGVLLRLIKEVDMPGEWRAIILNEHATKVRKNMRRLPEALLFTRRPGGPPGRS